MVKDGSPRSFVKIKLFWESTVQWFDVELQCLGLLPWTIPWYVELVVRPASFHFPCNFTSPPDVRGVPLHVRKALGGSPLGPLQD